ncbi:MAG: T9SS type A sorting domain-containing protein [Bacteroidota bacterium]
MKFNNLKFYGVYFRINFKFFILPLVFFFVASFSFGANYYISAAGNNASNGTDISTPKLTLANIFSTYNLGAGDTIKVAAGTYTETGTTVGSDDEGFVIQGAALSAGVPTSIFDAASTARWLLLNNTNNDNITINNLTIKDHITTGSADPDGGGGVKIIAGCTGFSVNNCVFDNCDTKTSVNHRGGAIYSVEGITVTYCTFKNCNADRYGGAISIELAPSANSSITHSKFYSNVTTSGNYGTALFFGVGSTSVLNLENCLFYKNGVSLGESVICCMNSTGTLNLMNCTVTANGNASYGTGGILTLSSAKINITNSIIYANLGTTYNDVYNNSGTITMKNCCYGSSAEINTITTNTSPLVANPLFTSSASDDYTLQGTSPCIDFGTTVGAPTDDIRHYSRVSNPDAGAYESNGVMLPIELLSFNADCDNGKTIIKWSTLSETNNAFFTLEKSYDLENWNFVAILDGAGNSNSILNYSIIDDANYLTAYYRLKQTDFDGRYEYFKILPSNCGNSDEDVFNVFPNPSDNNFNIEISSEENESLTVEIYNSIGQKLFESKYKTVDGINTIQLSDLKLSKNTYLLRVISSKSKIFNKKIVIN